MSDITSAAVASAASIPTGSASRYLQQLCKHFAHKCPVTFDPQKGHITFTIGNCHLAADDTALVLNLQAPDAQAMAQLQDVVARHLESFAFREPVNIHWSQP